MKSKSQERRIRVQRGGEMKREKKLEDIIYNFVGYPTVTNEEAKEAVAEIEKLYKGMRFTVSTTTDFEDRTIREVCEEAALDLSRKNQYGVLKEEYVKEEHLYYSGEDIKNDVHFKRNFIHVRDVARAIIHAMEHASEMDGEAYNVGLDDANLDKIELCEAIRRQVPEFVWHQAPLGEDPDKRNYIVSNQKIGRTGFRPVVSLDRGIAELVRGYHILRRNQYSNV